MKISCNILKKHIKDSSEIDFFKIWNIFTIRTAEVEKVEYKGKDIKDVVVGEIIECEQHPKKDKYHILKVDTGKEIVDILCGAPNVKKGLKAPIVKVGGCVCGITIEPKEIAGVLSSGMLCSKEELGISDDHSGIMELPNDFIVGKDIKDYYPIDDIIVEIDNKSLTHRPDLWGHYGIAREIAAITNHKLLDLPLLDIPNTGDKLDIKINNPELCSRYLGLKIDNISTNKTPEDIQIALYYTGMRSISLLVDLTNYIMIELGQPMHAFDSRRVRTIEIGLASNNDKFITLDKVERSLTNEDLMIKKNKEYFAIAGVMGGLDSEVTDDTDSIVLESATFDPFAIRKTAIRLGLRTDASARYEKTLDPNLALIASKRFAYLLKSVDSNITFGSRITDVYPRPLKELKIKLFKTTVIRNINENISNKEIINILTTLGFKVKELKEHYEVIVPTYRATKDITIEADLIEEIARMYGYENFKKVPLKIDMTIDEHLTPYKMFYKIKRFLATKYCMNEVHTYIWYKTSFLNKLKIDKNNVKLLWKNEDNILRDDMSLSLLDAVSLNLKNKENTKMFEIGTVIENNVNQQILSFAIADNSSKIDEIYYLSKNIINDIFKLMKNKEVLFKKVKLIEDYYNKDLSLDIIVDNKEIGKIKVLNNNYANVVAKKKSIVCGEINMDLFFTIDKSMELYKEISKYPTVSLDYTLITAESVKYMDINDRLNQFKSPLIVSRTLVNRYSNDNENKYTFRYVLGLPDKTLEQSELDEFKNAIYEHFAKNNLKLLQ